MKPLIPHNMSVTANKTLFAMATKHQPVNPTKAQKNAKKPAKAPNNSNCSDRSVNIVDVGQHSEASELEFEFVSHEDAPHSSYNSHADHKWKYKEDTDEDLFREARRFVVEAEDDFEKVEQDEHGTSSRNGAADIPEKYNQQSTNK